MAARVVIDGAGHIQGKLAAVCAKSMLNGTKVVVVRCEDILMSGDHRFNHHKFARYIHKQTNTNPRQGPFHKRAPSEIFKKSVRGMCNYKTTRGAKALGKLKTFEGIPPKYEHQKLLCVPQALKEVALRRDRPTTTLGEMATSFGWKYGEVVARLEKQRVARLAATGVDAAAKQAAALQRANAELGEAAVRFLETYEE